MNTRDDQRISDLLHRANPVESAEGPLDHRAETDLARILGTRSNRPLPRRLVPVIAAAAVVLTVGAGALVVQPWKDSEQLEVGAPRFQVTNTRPAPVQLRELAAQVRALPAEPVTGPVLKVEVQNWGVDYIEGKAQEARSSTITYYVHNGARHHVERNLMVTGDKVHWPKLSADAKVLRTQLVSEHGQGGEAHLMTSAVVRLQHEANPSPAVRAAILELLATLPGITADGETTDQLGRKAVGFSVNSEANPVRITLLIDPHTGVLLGHYQVTTRALPMLKLPAGGLAEYRIFVSRTYQADLPATKRWTPPTR